MMRALYGAAWTLAVPLAVARLAWRARRTPGYLDHLGERFGFHAAVGDGAPPIWIHAVSVGETRAAAPLVEALAAQQPGTPLLITHMTPTGRATGAALFGDRVRRAWLPYDTGFAARRFLRSQRPRAGILLETEIWPRLLEEASRAGIPMVLANARLSARSARRYARFPSLTRWALGNLAGIAAQSEADAERFRSLGATSVVVTGNVKFDVAVPEPMRALGRAMRERIGPRPVWVAGSTREGEEEALLAAFAREQGDALLVLVPRHPHRFDEVAAAAQAQGLQVQRRSLEAPVAPEVRVLVGDSMGEMLAYYAAADVVIMGGSLLDYGSQNLIEPCALAKPVVMGPSTYNFEEAAEAAIRAGAGLRVPTAAAALAAARELTRDPSRCREMGAKAQAFVAAHRGAVDRLVAWLEAGALSARARG